MFHSVFERITYLEYQLQAKKALIAAFESGDKYVQMQGEYRNNLRHLEIRIKNLEAELESAYRSHTKMRKNWMDVFEDLEKEMKKTEKIFQSHMEQLSRKLLTVEQERDEAKDKIKEQRLEIYALKTELGEEQGKNRQLLAQINRDYENSSIPSSKKENRKKITNSREKTNKKPGAQPGHKHHGRKKQVPTEPGVTLMPPQEILDDPEFKPTGKFITKQLVRISLKVQVQEYQAEIYRNSIEPGSVIEEAKLKEIEQKYTDILKTAEDEYAYEPPSQYYINGYNLYKRMEKYMSNHLLFLHDLRVPATNNEAERLLRGYKRKQAQAVSFRSFESIENLCRCMGMLIGIRKNPEANIFQKLSNMFV